MGGVIVARNLPFEVTEICSPELAISKYFNRLALKSLILIVCMGRLLKNIVQLNGTSI
jgi:hypothetical protein